MKYSKDYFINKPKSAIFCDTKQKWDIITKELGLTWDESEKWSTYKDDTAIIPDTNQYFRKTWYEVNGFEIIDFNVVDLSGAPVVKNTKRIIPTITAKPTPIGDIIGVKVIKDFPNSDNIVLGTEIFEHGDLSNKWKNVTYYKQFPEFFDFIYGFKPIFFGGKEVKIKKFNNINCIIECDGKTDDYIHLKELKNLIKQLNNFNFGGQKLELVASSNFSDYKLSLSKLKFGCTTGTIYELEEIISQCEKILSQ